MRKMRALTLLVSAFVMIAAGCSKEGPSGPQGSTGPQGPPGATGATGTANVIYSAWFATSTLTWADSTHTDYGTISRGNRAAAGVTTAVIDQGVVLAYYRNAATAGTTPLPYVFGTTATEIKRYGFILKTGTITFFAANLTTGTATGVTPPGEFRYVIIPGSVSGGRVMNGIAAGYSVSDLKAMSYQQVLNLFHIPEDGSSK
jgi:hypothetical protein